MRRAERLATGWNYLRPRLRWRDVFMVALIGLSMLYAAHAVNSSNRQWCDTLTLLTARPVPKPPDPSANPSRMQAYTLYADFVTLRNRLGC